MKILFRIVYIAILLYSIQVLAQEKRGIDNDTNVYSILMNDSTNYPGIVSLYQDTLIEKMLFHSIELNKRDSGLVEGYRINIYRGSGFDESGIHSDEKSKAIKDTFDVYFPDIPSYRRYEDLYYKVYVGDFRNKADNLITFKKIKRMYPNAFWVNDKINYLLVD